jgi:glycine betaine/proline transport system ATP-binding protein
MAGLLPPSRGALRVLGADMAGASEEELVALRRHKVAMVFQDFALLPHLTALENVAFPLRVQGIARHEREETARRVLELAGLKEREAYYPHELSGGQQQRVGIARSLTTDPELWFLDEPFSALDPLIRHDMQDELLRLQALLKKTVVFITHDFDEAIRLASRIAIMKDGAVVQTDTPEGLVLRPAEDYVARFTRKVALAEIVTVGSAMRAPDPAAEGPPVEAASLVKAAAPRVLDSGRAVPVADHDGRIVGALTPAAVRDILLRRMPEPSP